MRNIASKHDHSDVPSVPFSGGVGNVGSSSPRQHLLHKIGHQHLLESGGWADRGSPGTNEMRRRRKLGADFDQYSRSRRKVIVVTFAMTAAFSLISGLSSRMATSHGINDRGLNVSKSYDGSSDQLILVSNTSTRGSGIKDTPNISLVSWCLAVSSFAAATACIGSFFFCGGCHSASVSLCQCCS